MKSIKIRAKASNGSAMVKCLIKHPMEAGRRKSKKTGEIIPALYITEILAVHNDKQVYTALLSGGVSKNPFLAFKLKDVTKGDKLKITWLDSDGKTDTLETNIK